MLYPPFLQLAVQDGLKSAFHNLRSESKRTKKVAALIALEENPILSRYHLLQVERLTSSIRYEWDVIALFIALTPRGSSCIRSPK